MYGNAVPTGSLRAPWQYQPPAVLTNLFFTHNGKELGQSPMFFLSNTRHCRWSFIGFPDLLERLYAS
jgi:hypothetical protein